MISLNKSIRTTKVDDGWAPRINSDRFLNPIATACPVWNGFDLTGRIVPEDSFMTKEGGCNSALDRVSVEISHRPKYAGYVTLNMRGLSGGSDIFGIDQYSMMLREEDINTIASGPNFGNNIQKNIETDSSPYTPLDKEVRRQYSNSESTQKTQYVQRNPSFYNRNMVNVEHYNSNDIPSAFASPCNDFKTPTYPGGLASSMVCGSQPSNTNTNNIECSNGVCKFK